MKGNLLDAFAQSNRVFETSMTKMTDCLTSLGSGIASAMQMVAMALSGQPQSLPLDHGQVKGYPQLQCLAVMFVRTTVVLSLLVVTCIIELESVLVSFHMKLDHFSQRAITVQ